MNDHNLKKLIKAFRDDKSVAKVGILGSKTDRKESDGPTNAEIGAAHEFGANGLPIRSFLRRPISDKLQEYLDKSNGFNKKVLLEVIASGTLVPWLKTIGVLGETIVLDAFDTGGFGVWPPSKGIGKKDPKTGELGQGSKANNQTLVETGQLRNSISSEVK